MGPIQNYLKDGKPAGLAVEMVQALLKDAGVSAQIEFAPRNRAYYVAQREPNMQILR